VTPQLSTPRLGGVYGPNGRPAALLGDEECVKAMPLKSIQCWGLTRM